MVSRQLLKYLVVGGICTILDAGLFAVFLSLHINPALGNMLSYGTGAIAHFFLNRHWTFARYTPVSIQRLIPALLWGVTGTGISTGLVFVFGLILPVLGAKAVSIFLMTIINYRVSANVIFTPLTAHRSP